ncbi:MAG: bifunctional 2-methylcitrate synthase/citrate synthase [Alphaproteobacteria bacterium]
MTDDADIKYGLAGVVADVTAVSKVMVETNALTYRGYAVQDLSDHCSFEEVAFLLLHDDLPDRARLDAFCRAERAERQISDELQTVIGRFRNDAHPMDTLRTAVSFLGVEDTQAGDNSPAADMAKAMRMLARIPTIIATDYRLRNDLSPIPPRADLSMAENFFHMCFDEVPPADVVNCFDISLILYAEHSFNASTFTARTIASTESDIHSAITGAIGALKGPLHGGANEAVMHMMLEIDDPDRAREWMLDALAQKRKIMGFGHRVYRSGDSRVPTMTQAFHRMAAIKGGDKWVRMSTTLAETMIAEKGIHPNLDFPTGPAYYLMGFDIPMFTPIFVMSRITGWAAHVFEQRANNKLIRPLSAYRGAEQRPVTPLAARG